jgi:PncC family amidohydrolase
MMKQVIAQLIQHHLTLGSIESVTGGAFASQCVQTPGASSWFKGSFVTYQHAAKHEWLGIPRSLNEEIGLVSESAAALMLQNGLVKLGVDILVVSTGSAGPTAEMHSAVGDVYIGVANPTKTNIRHFNFLGSREMIRQQSVLAMIDMLNEFLRTYY